MYQKQKYNDKKAGVEGGAERGAAFLNPRQ